MLDHDVVATGPATAIKPAGVYLSHSDTNRGQMPRGQFRLWFIGAAMLCAFMSLIAALEIPKGAAPATKLMVLVSYNAVALGASLAALIVWLVVRVIARVFTQ
jgi:hypothetical protein